jgi:hypothetical protein
MSDLVKRLRAPVTVERHDGLLIEAADEIKRLRDRTTCLSGDIYRLRAALKLADAKLGGEFMPAGTAEVRAAIAKALGRP